MMSGNSGIAKPSVVPFTLFVKARLIPEKSETAIIKNALGIMEFNRQCKTLNIKLFWREFSL